MIGFIVGIFAFRLPLIVNQAVLVSELSIQTISARLGEPLMKVEGFFHERGILPTNQTLSDKIIGERYNPLWHPTDFRTYLESRWAS